MNRVTFNLKFIMFYLVHIKQPIWVIMCNRRRPGFWWEKIMYQDSQSYKPTRYENCHYSVLCMLSYFIVSHLLPWVLVVNIADTTYKEIVSFANDHEKIVRLSLESVWNCRKYVVSCEIDAQLFGSINSKYPQTLERSTRKI